VAGGIEGTLAGVLGLIIFGPLTWLIRQTHVQAELRKSKAKDP